MNFYIENWINSNILVWYRRLTMVLILRFKCKIWSHSWNWYVNSKHSIFNEINCWIMTLISLWLFAFIFYFIEKVFLLSIKPGALECNLHIRILLFIYCLWQACPTPSAQAKWGPWPNFDQPVAWFIMNGIWPTTSIVDTIDGTNRLTIICLSHHMWPSGKNFGHPWSMANSSSLVTLIWCHPDMSETTWTWNSTFSTSEYSFHSDCS